MPKRGQWQRFYVLGWQRRFNAMLVLIKTLTKNTSPPEVLLILLLQTAIIETVLKLTLCGYCTARLTSFLAL